MWRRVLAAVMAAAGAFLLVGVSLAAEDIVGSERGGMLVAAVGFVLLVGLVPLGLLAGAYLLARSANRPRPHALSWVPVDDRWLDEKWWSELPDPLPRYPRRRARPSPAGPVPPDEVQRKLRVVSAELAADRRRAMGWLPPTGWLGMLLLAPAGIFFVGGLFVLPARTGTDLAAGLLVLEWLGALTVACWMAVYRPLRRHTELVRLEQQLRAG